MRFALAAVVLSLAAAGCGAGEPEPAEDPVGSPRYTGVVYIEERNGSLGIGPPGCIVPAIGGEEEQPGAPCGVRLPLATWDWDVVEGEESVDGVIWGMYRVLGTYDGETFSIESAEPADGAPDPFAEIYAESDAIVAAECPEPPGGWTASEPARTSVGDQEAADRYARGQPEAAGSWMVRDTGTEAELSGDEIVVAWAFTGNLEAHEAELRVRWGGPMCVVAREQTERELRGVQRDLEKNGREIGLDWDQVGASEIDGRVHVHAFIAPPDVVASLDARYGAGLVRVTADLKPVR